MNAKDLVGLAVITLSNAHKVGTTSEVMFDPEFRRVVAFRVNPGGLFHHDEAVLRSEVSAVGSDALTISGPTAVNREERYPELATAKLLHDLTGIKVVTEGGTLLGTVGEAILDPEAREVERYVLATSIIGRLRHEEQVVLPGQVVRLGGDNIMIVRESAGTGAQSEATATRG